VALRSPSSVSARARQTHLNAHLVVEDVKCCIEELVAGRVVDCAWSLRYGGKCRVLNATHGMTTSDELRIMSAHQITRSYAHAHLDHLVRRKALPCEVRRVLCQRILWLGHSRWSRLRRVDSSAAKRNVVTTAGTRYHISVSQKS
jgi:hypothetical protein